MSIACSHRYDLNNAIKISLPHQSFRISDRAAVQGNKPGQKIVLAGGARLAALMIEHNLGVSTAQTFALKRLDTDFFEED